jgi:hypothetical protein
MRNLAISTTTSLFEPFLLTPLIFCNLLISISSRLKQGKENVKVSIKIDHLGDLIEEAYMKTATKHQIRRCWKV